MTDQKKSFPEFYITAPQPCPYLPGRAERKLFTHLTREKSRATIDDLLRNGFRRSQNIAYTPYCDGCTACVSVRILVDEFEPGRTMRRTLEANRDLVARRIPPVPTSEQYSLFRSYIEHRHGDGGMAEMSMLDYFMMVEDSIIDTGLVEYRERQPGMLDSEFDKWPLIGAALTDRLSDGLSMVYSFYEPDAPVRSLGTYMILEHIAAARKMGLPYVYLGYWIQGSRKMAYKTRFHPQERLTSRGWVRAGR
ncbi:MAG: arginyltransferase [Hyphomicrobiaceae bacterium]